MSLDSTGTLTAREYLIGLRLAYAFDAFTSGEGPIQFGVAHPDYGSSEIEEALEASGSWSIGDQIALEQSRRKVRTVGVFKPGDGEGINDGKPIWTKCGWYLESGEVGYKLWMRNLDLVNPLTTGGLLKADGNAVLRPVR